jgi:hypothetical protein
MRDLYQEVLVSALREGALRSTYPRLPKNKQREQPRRVKMMSRFSSFSLAVVLSLASAAPTLAAAETNRQAPAELLSAADLKDYARRESGIDNRIFIRAPAQTGSIYSSQNPYRDFLNGGKPTPAAALLSNPKALLAESRRESGLDANRSASIGSYRGTYAAVRTNLKPRQLAARSAPE